MSALKTWAEAHPGRFAYPAPPDFLGTTFLKQAMYETTADPLHVYLTIASLGYFYLTNQYTLSTIFGRDLITPASLETWERHIVHVTLASIKR